MPLTIGKASVVREKLLYGLIWTVLTGVPEAHRMGHTESDGSQWKDIVEEKIGSLV